MSALLPGSTIGILGGGQLGRMLAMAAARLGLKCHVYAPEADSPAFDVVSEHTIAAYDDEVALAKFAACVDAVTYEFENIPVATVSSLAALVPVRPGAKALACAQDRVNEKTLGRTLGAGTADFAEINSLTDLERALKNITPPCILKTRRFGYDGKGQAKLLEKADAKGAWKLMRDQPSILESFIDFQIEVSVIAARALDGEFRAFDVTENEHRHHILHRSLAPARITEAAAKDAVAIAERFATELDYVGVFAIEFFCLHATGRDVLCVNEMAPRVHNSGHWTIDGAVTSQFEQHMRAVAGWPLGSTARKAPAIEMINLIGDDIHAWQDIAADTGAFLHHYGKKEARKGRKMGHVNRLLPALPLSDGPDHEKV